MSMKSHIDAARNGRGGRFIAKATKIAGKRRVLYVAGGALAAVSLTIASASDNDAGIDMVLVKGGEFTMGCTDNKRNVCQDQEMPPHGVIVSDFYIGRYEVTQKQWVKIMGDNPSENKRSDLPVTNVSWDDVQEFIERLNSKTGKKYRLPTEAKWEYAARGGAKSKKYVYSGSNNLDDVAWYDVNSGKKILKDNIRGECRDEYGDGYYNYENRYKDICKDRYNEILRSNKNMARGVGTKKANELGIFDMSGNVIEWVNDRYAENWYRNEYNSGVSTDPQGPTEDQCRWGTVARRNNIAPGRCANIGRGGGWKRDVRYCHVSWRHWYYPNVRYDDLGFRLAISK